MWFIDCDCHFSLDHFANTETASSGMCDIKGHKTIGSDFELESVTLRFNDQPQRNILLNYQAGEWGPVSEHTDLRFYGLSLNDNKDYHSSWLWEGTDEHCAVCDPDRLGYPGVEEWGKAGVVGHSEDAYFKGVENFDSGNDDAYDPTKFDTTDVEE